MTVYCSDGWRLSVININICNLNQYIVQKNQIIKFNSVSNVYGIVHCTNVSYSYNSDLLQQSQHNITASSVQREDLKRVLTSLDICRCFYRFVSYILTQGAVKGYGRRFDKGHSHRVRSQIWYSVQFSITNTSKGFLSKVSIWNTTFYLVH